MSRYVYELETPLAPIGLRGVGKMGFNPEGKRGERVEVAGILIWGCTASKWSETTSQDSSGLF